MTHLENAAAKQRTSKEIDIAFAMQYVVQTDLPLSSFLGRCADQIKLYEGESGDSVTDGWLATQPSKNRRYLIETDSCDQVGFRRGDIIELDDSAKSLWEIEAGAVVVARVGFDPERRKKGVLVLRQFLPPCLLMTNSTKENPPPVSIVQAGISIVGIATVITTNRRLHQDRSRSATRPPTVAD